MLLTTCVSLLSFPLVISGLGADTWARFAAAQAVAALLSVVVGWGWAVTGPSRVAALRPELRGEYWADSVAVRAILALGAIPVGASWTALIVDERTAPSTVVGLATLLGNGLSSSWYYAGLGQARRLFKIVSLPSAVGVAVCAALAALTSSAWVYVSALSVVTVATLIVSTIDVWKLAGMPHMRTSRHRLKSAFVQQASGVVVAGISTTFVSLPLVFAAAVYPQQLSELAMADRLYRVGRTAVTPVTQSFQSHIPDSEDRLTFVRTVRSLPTLVIFSCIAALGFSFGAPLVATLLSGSTIAVGVEIAAAYGLALSGLVITSVLGVACLAVVGRGRWLVGSVVAGAVCGVALIAAGVIIRAGILGIAAAIAVAELVVLGVQLAGFMGLARTARRAGWGAPRAE